MNEICLFQFSKFTYAIISIKERIADTSSIWSTGSLTTAVLGCIALNYFSKETKHLEFQEKIIMVGQKIKFFKFT